MSGSWDLISSQTNRILISSSMNEGEGLFVPEILLGVETPLEMDG